MRLRFAILALAPLALAQTQSRDDRWRADIDFLTTELPNKHPNLFTRTPREEWLTLAARLKAAVPDLRDYQVQAGLARLAAAGGDAHTSISGIAAGSRNFPIRVQWFEEGLFVTRAGFPYARALGKRIVSIGGVPVADAFNNVKQYISHENDQWAKQQGTGYLINAELLHAAEVLREVAPTDFVFEDTAGARFTLQIPPGDLTTLPGVWPARPRNPLYLRNPDMYYWFEWLPDTKTLYIKYNNCTDSPALPMADFARQVVEFASANPVEHLVLDLRHNAGGNSAVIVPLLTALGVAVDRGFIRPARQPVCIIGRQTISSGMLNAIDLKQAGVLLVGEPTGGKPVHYGEVQSFRLPNSGLTVSHSTRLFRLGGDESSLMPDLAVPATAAAYFAERDEFLEAALR